MMSINKTTLPLACAVLFGLVATASTAEDTADIEPVSGISKSALVAIMGIPDGGDEKLYGIFYIADKIDPAQLAAAPERICASRGLSLISARDLPLEHESEMPGVKKYMVRCK